MRPATAVSRDGLALGSSGPCSRGPGHVASCGKWPVAGLPHSALIASFLLCTSERQGATSASALGGPAQGGHWADGQRQGRALPCGHTVSREPGQTRAPGWTCPLPSSCWVAGHGGKAGQCPQASPSVPSRCVEAWPQQARVPPSGLPVCGLGNVNWQRPRASHEEARKEARCRPGLEQGPGHRLASARWAGGGGLAPGEAAACAEGRGCSGLRAGPQALAGACPQAQALLAERWPC